ncbi:Calmodulin isoform 1 [Schistosoma japonicum]|uniref:Calmodulin isoform 1 n=1 Tax=Schistosoma japonicum TaxID=6182 RepID=A0A4Z2DL94_SCHJA|nr:Calmodulin isoform 1 [Schistosoma japonicum]
MVSKDVLLDIFYTELSQAFRHIDKDGDGLLGVDDISNLLTKLGIGVNESSISNVVRSLSDGEVFIRLPLFIELVGRSLDNLDDNQPVRTLFRLAFLFFDNNFKCSYVYQGNKIYTKCLAYWLLKYCSAIMMAPYIRICSFIHSGSFGI